jgi:23S rRNA pseudouridine2605 synthase
MNEKSKKPVKKVTSPAVESDQERGERIAKVMARLGLCSRRDAEKMIAERRVTLNGETVTTPATFVQPSDKIGVDGQSAGKREPLRLFLYHKPPGLITSAKDPEGRPTVFDTLPKTLPRLISVGRLDLNTEGLLLLTNDGGLSRALELPSSGLMRTYRVRVHGRIHPERLEKLKEGLMWKGVRYGSIIATTEGVSEGTNTWLRMSLSEGKNREIRNVMEALNLQVNRLIRLSYGPFELGPLKRGDLVEIKSKAIKDLLKEHLPEEILARLF